MLEMFDASGANELYQVKLSESTKFFKEYAGKTFREAAYLALNKHVNLIGVRSAERGTIILNPGESYTMVCELK